MFFAGAFAVCAGRIMLDAFHHTPSLRDDREDVPTSSLYYVLGVCEPRETFILQSDGITRSDFEIIASPLYFNEEETRILFPKVTKLVSSRART